MRTVHWEDFVKVGDKIKAQILTLDREDRKMSLGIKQLSACYILHSIILNLSAWHSRSGH